MSTIRARGLCVVAWLAAVAAVACGAAMASGPAVASDPAVRSGTGVLGSAAAPRTDGVLRVASWNIAWLAAG
ncbi:MAG TPA: hypothetical protein VFQ07_12305, partial [Candidatus Polarisedimenticolia bacterium]|nr:hypothetical protein [Candidatus Polarisedimenticolia bacterium]